MVGVCASCGAPLTGEARFCSSCGAAVGTAAPKEARRIVTALFADVVGSTTLGERMDPEDFKDVVGRAVTAMAEGVAEFGGSVSEYAGDGLLALFGAPTAHEDDPERAVLAGLRIVESTHGIAAAAAAEHGVEGLAVRVGIETGLAVLGPVGGGGKVEYGALGDALNTAARLQAAAEPMSVLVGAQTRRSIDSLFEWGESRELTLKGKAEPVLAAPALSRRARAEGAGGSSPLVGRDREVAGAQEAVADVLRGTGSILIVSGDAGIGKTRLVAEAHGAFERAQTALGRPLWLDGRCVSYGDGLPYWPFRMLLRGWLSAISPLAEDDMTAALRSESARLLGEEAPLHSPRLEPLLGLVSESPGDPEETRRGIHMAARALVKALAAEGPLAISLDDLHWADASSLALAEALLDLVEAEPLLLVLTSRPEHDHSFWALRERILRNLSHRAREIALEPLPPDSGGGLLRALTGSADLPAELERRVLARAEGNPFYLEELVGSLVDAGALVREGESWRFDREIPVDVPETVEKVVLARIDRLSEAAHQVLSVAAVLGRQFPVALLEAVAGAGPETAAARTELERAGLLRDGGRVPAPMLSFKHALIQESAYGSLLKRRRQELHRDALQALTSLYPDRRDEFLGMLAHHAEAAGDDRAAVQLHFEAAEAAQRIYSVEEALEHYGGVVAAASRIEGDEAAERLRRARFASSLLLYDNGDIEEARVELEESMRLAREAGDRDLEAEALVGLAGLWRIIDFTRAEELMLEATRVSAEARSPGPGVYAHARLSIIYANEVRFDRSQAAAEKALELAEAADSVQLRAVAWDALKLTAQQLGDLELLEELVDRLVPVLRSQEASEIYLEWAILESAFVSLGHGDFDEAIRRIDEAVSLVQQRGRLMHEALFHDAVCWARRSQGELGLAIEAGMQAAEMAHSFESREWGAWADATLGWAYLDARAPTSAISALERGLQAAEAVRMPAQLARNSCLLAWARCQAGAPSGADLARAEEHLARVRTPPGRAWLFGAHAYVALARAHLATGNAERAIELMEPIAVAAQASRWLEPAACAHLVIGQAHAAGNNAAAARTALERAVELAVEGALPTPGWEANAALAELARSEGREDDARAARDRARTNLQGLIAGLGGAAPNDGLIAAIP